MSCYNRYSASSALLVWDENTSVDRVKFDRHSTSAIICLHYAMYSHVPWLMYNFIIRMLLLQALYFGINYFLLFGVVIFC